MKTKLSNAIILVLGLLVQPVIVQAAPDPNFHIYLLFGQSNMEGQGAVSQQDRVTNPRVRVMQDETCDGVGTYGVWRVASPPLIRCVGKLGPGDYFGKTMAENTPDNITIGLVGAAYQGQSIGFFLKDCALRGTCTPLGANGAVPGGHRGGYAWLLDLAKKAQEAGVIKGILLHQGESDTGQQDWTDRVNTIVANLRKDLNLGEVPLLAGEMVPGGCCTAHNAIIRQLPQKLSNSHVISADGLSSMDQFHFNSESYRELGRRYANKMLTLVDAGPQDCGTQDGNPVCCNVNADPDDDGWGTQNGQSCLVTPDTTGYLPTNSTEIAAAINVGADTSAVYNNITYGPDRDFTGGQTNSTSDVIVGAGGSAVFQSERYGDFTYEIPLSNGNYSVELNMAELYWTAAGERSFSVEIEGTTIASNIDIFQRVGADTAYTPAKVNTTVADSSLTINVITNVNNGTLSGIVVRKTTSASSSSNAQSSSASSSGTSSGSAGSVNWVFFLLLGLTLVSKSRRLMK